MFGEEVTTGQCFLNSIFHFFAASGSFIVFNSETTAATLSYKKPLKILHKSNGLLVDAVVAPALEFADPL